MYFVSLGPSFIKYSVLGADTLPVYWPDNRVDGRIRWGERKHLTLVIKDNARDDLCEGKSKDADGH